MTNALLDITSKRIKLLERGTVNNAYQIGALLQQVFDICEHGRFQEWIAREFGWSYRTAVRYRSVFALAQKCHCVTFDDLNISLTAVYFAADQENSEVARAILRAAKVRRVTVLVATQIAADCKPAPESLDYGEDRLKAGDYDAATPDEGPERPDAEPRSPLTKHIRALLAADHRKLSDAVAQIGAEDVGRLTVQLERICRQSGDTDAVKSAADRAAARSAEAARMSGGPEFSLTRERGPGD